MEMSRPKPALGGPRSRLPLLLLLVLLASLVVGGGMTVHLLGQRGLTSSEVLKWELIWPLVLFAPPLLALNIIIRFFRWHFLLRAAGAYLPERQSLRVYLSSFALNFTPFYIGPTLFRVLALKSDPPIPQMRRRIVGATVSELFYDASGMALIGLATALVSGGVESAWPLAVIVLASVVPFIRDGLALGYCVVVNASARLFGSDEMGLSKETLGRVFGWQRYFPALAMSVLAWSFPPVLLWILTRKAGVPMPLTASARALSEGTVAGAIIPSFGGAGVTGEWIRRQAETAGFALPAVVILYYRLGTFWLALAMGGGVALAGRLRRSPVLHGQHHFNQISEVYDAQIPELIRKRLLDRKTAFMLDRLRGSGALAMQPAGLDLGCGQGHYARRMKESGCRMTGADVSIGQARGAAVNIESMVVAGAEGLPFRDHAFDFAYCINILHHLPSRESQRLAMREISRVLKPGGIFFLHEINTDNWLFRFYMGYVFPVLREIDTGVELWIQPSAWDVLGDWRPAAVDYYTFLPDFAPPWMVGRLRPLEARLERSRWRHLSAHYSAVFIMPSLKQE